MSSPRRNLVCRFTQILSLLLLTAMTWPGVAPAAQLGASWTDNSTNEDGFKIERMTGTTGTFAQVATVGANITAYADPNLSAGTTYCYRVRAFNAAGGSAYSNQACGTTAVASFTITVTNTGSGSGTVSSSPAGIACGTTCSASYSSGTTVTLTATAAPGSTFTGWSGGGCSGTGSCTVTLSANTSVAATFTSAPQSFTLTVAKVGNGSGTVSSSPAGITCGATCSASYSSGTTVTLTATAAAGSTFTGWSGGGCSGTGSCTVTLSADTSVAATFTLQPQSFTLTVAKVGNGSGTVSSSPAGIACGAICFASYSSGTTVTLTATPTAGSTFSGWSGGGCSGTGTCMVTLNATTSVSATFTQPMNVRIGVFDPNTGYWYLDRNGNGVLDDCTVDACLGPFGTSSQLPVVGDWTGTGTARIGVFDPSTGNWYLDRNGNGKLDDCTVDSCLGPFGQQGDLPVVGSWTGSGRDLLGVFRPSTGNWYLDLNGNGVLDDCGVGGCLGPFGQAGDLPAVGSWTGSGIDLLGVFRPSTGNWYLDRNGNGKLDDCTVDSCLGPFGQQGDLPVVGSWTGSGIDLLGVFRPSTGNWYLDLNGNGRFKNCRRDGCLGPFGLSGDLPIAGDWTGTGTARIGVFDPSTGNWYLDRNGNGKLDDCTVDSCLGSFGQQGDLPVVGKW